METAFKVAIGGILLFWITACTPGGEIHQPAQELAPTIAVTPTSAPTATHAVTASPTPPPAPTATQTAIPTETPLTCWQEGGRIETHLLYSDFEEWPWELRVYTPPCYDQMPDQHYPLLILIHGSSFNDDQWDRLGADETADAMIASGELPPFIMLMPRDKQWVDPLDDPFGEGLIRDMIPWVDQTYRTIPGRDFRAIGGLSRGASWAVHLGLKHWDMFSAIGAHSLPVFVSDPPRLERWLDEIPRGQLPRIFMDIGEKDYLIETAIWFEGLLTEKNIPHEWYLYPGYHEESYWIEHIEQYLRWYTAPWGE